MMEINIASCSLVPFGCCHRIGKLVYPCEKGIQKGYEVQSWHLRGWKTERKDPMPATFPYPWRPPGLWLPAFPTRLPWWATCQMSQGSHWSSSLHNCKITTKVNIWGQVYFGQTSSSLVSKIRNSAGCTWFGHPARELGLRDVLCSYLLLLAWKCASEPSLVSVHLCRPTVHAKNALSSSRGYAPTPCPGWQDSHLHKAQTPLSVPHRLPAKPSKSSALILSFFRTFS